MSKSFTKSFPADRSAFTSIMTWVNSYLENTALCLSDRRKVEIASEEVIINILRHAFAGSRGEINLIVEVNHCLKISFIDTGKAFNPIAYYGNTKREKKSLEEMEVGGLGIRFFMELMDHVDYQRIDDQNILTLKKQIDNTSH